MKRTPLQRKTPLTSGGPRRKRCPECRVMFTPARTGQSVCGEIDCAIAHGQSEKGRAIAGKALAEVGRREIKVRKEALKSRSDHMKDTQQAFNEFIRWRDRVAGQACISSGRQLDWSGNQTDAGHYRSVGSAPHLRFDERNCHAQSKQDNRFLSGNAVDYRIGLIARIGLAAVEALEADQSVRKYTIEQLKELKDEYRAKTRSLRSVSEAS
ncbi:recombination protein NinG [Pseudomonas ficuserectae]|uniref:Bacteriophage lambda NinG protein n=1 Tax=Pseudomonas amygdali pv. lachrymans TaxID=53707 RepID=A0AB37R5J6_PSEAV|nr:recombination protein NinG [Pseudomonas amygdali]KKY52744.1 ninG protein [Pseudomonas amygdali pv. lachrymans]KPB98111.1 Bacteriophage lambda NinG family protein [Pseudomonas amygdali pv. lachrymans]RMM34628.1 Bacteriophage lambda NinG protein [Pseudomonas amygdali pv. lachrymans]RMU16065.1 Bacteriophage lambda NinG protein [Pseudomonas amygdali pv. lachrymans]WIO56281.1 recombination protein NinG [Pseudomonas amygdali pv. lachrymans]